MFLYVPEKPAQVDLGKLTGTSGDVIGRYERSDITPSIDVVAKIADALEVSVDYLIGKTKMQLDKQAVKRLEDISKLPEENKTFVLNLIDLALRDFKVKKHTHHKIKMSCVAKRRTFLLRTRTLPIIREKLDSLFIIYTQHSLICFIIIWDRYVGIIIPEPNNQ